MAKWKNLYGGAKPDWSRQSRSAGYKTVYFPEHPRAWSTGHVHLHVVLAEQKIGRLLKKGEIVHHDDEDKMNNHRKNLVAVSSASEHTRLHRSRRPAETVMLKCPQCKKKFDRFKRNVKLGTRKYFCSRSCRSRFYILTGVYKSFRHVGTRTRRPMD